MQFPAMIEVEIKVSNPVKTLTLSYESTRPEVVKEVVNDFIDKIVKENNNEAV